MHSANDTRIIAERLFREGICTSVLDERSLLAILNYMEDRHVASDLKRRLSNVEYNFAQLYSSAENARTTIQTTTNSTVIVLRHLTDAWQRRGYLRDFTFSFSEEDCENIRASFSQSAELIDNYIKALSENLMLLGECSAQIKACSASCLEIYNDSRLANLAALLNRDGDSALECQSTSLLSHASAKECERFSIAYLGIARNCTAAISVINRMLYEVLTALRMDDESTVVRSFLSPSKAAFDIGNAILALNELSFEIRR